MITGVTGAWGAIEDLKKDLMGIWVLRDGGARVPTPLIMLAIRAKGKGQKQTTFGVKKIGGAIMTNGGAIMTNSGAI